MPYFTTRTGIKSKTASARLYIVVDDRDGEIIYRTDNAAKARERARKNSHYEVIKVAGS